MAIHSTSNETLESPVRGGPKESRDAQAGQTPHASDQPSRQGCLQDSRSAEIKETPKTTEGPVRGG